MGGHVVQSAGAGFLTLAGVVLSVLTAVSCEFVTGDLGLGLGATGVGLFKASITIAGITECNGYAAQEWQEYCGRAFVCLASIFGFMAMLELVGRENGCLRNCVGCCVVCAGPGLIAMAMICQSLTFLFLYDSSITKTDINKLGNGGIYSITAACCYALATCIASAAAKNEREEAYEQGGE